MRKMTIATLGVAALMATAAFAQAQEEVVITTGHLAAMDNNTDGSVDGDEFRRFVSRSVGALDRDADGAISWTEAELGIDRPTFDAIDTDGNGELSVVEIDAQSSRDFATADQDGDGVLN